MKAIQYFSDSYLQSCRGMESDQIIDFLNDFMEVHTSQRLSTKLISLKVEEDLLLKFKHKSQLEGLKYQTQIKNLMKEWLG